ncbi:hypothetical protein CHCC14814_0805 [Bacillus paralicheniformis]|nr:hypothetical protein CHCC14814_0805 [Bacillus paralicheniformis]
MSLRSKKAVRAIRLGCFLYAILSHFSQPKKKIVFDPL